MNRSIAYTVLVLTAAWFVPPTSYAQTSLISKNPSEPRVDGPRQIADKGLNHRIWQNFTRETLPSGRTVTNSHRVTELATGMYYNGADGTLIESEERIELVEGGAQATRGQHKVRFGPDITSATPVQLELPDGRLLKSRVLGLAYTDSATGKSILIAETKPSTGELLPPNQIIYRDAFTDINADVLYTYKRGSFEQDIVLHESPLGPDAWGLGAETTTLDVFTELVDPPAPAIKTETLPITPGAQIQLNNDTLTFGRMILTAGKAFALGQDRERAKLSRSQRVFKSWERRDARQFLIESLPYWSARQQMNALPRSAALEKRNRKDVQVAFASRDAAKMFPSRQMAKALRQPKVMRMASRPIDPKGYVVDYQAVLVNLSDDWSDGYRFEGDKTYHIADIVNLNNVIFEGGTVLKFGTTNYTALQLLGSVQCLTDPYHMAIFTSQMDETVGESLYAPGAPTNSYVPIAIASTNEVMQYIRISYADYAFHAYGINLRHSQIVHCGSAFFGDNGPLNADNVLVYDCATAFSGEVYQGAVTHLTIDRCNLLTEDLYDPAYSSLAFTNCLITDVANLGDVAFTTNNTVILSSSSGIYQTAGAASHYLATNSVHRDVGNTNIASWLKADIGKMTTFPPVVMPSTLVTNAMTLSPQAQRDVDVPDRGYHYVPLDYAIGDLAVYTTNGSLTIAPGTAIGAYQQSVYNYTLYLVDGGKITCEGSPTKLNHIARYNMVQEQANTNWAATRGYTLFGNNGGSATPQGRFRFTDWSTPAIDNTHVYIFESSGVFPLAFVDNQFHGGQLLLAGANFGLTNSLFDRVAISMSDGSHAFNAYFQNNLFYGGSNFIEHADSGTWKFRDNFFHGTDLVFDADPVDGDYNAYLTNAVQLSSSGTSHVKVLTNSAVSFQVGALGRYYLPSSVGLIDSGSTSSGTVGLYHYTTQTNQTKEASSTVDYSFHYVALDGTANPVDTDSDGIPDYLEDTNGNGSSDSGETNWQTYTSQNGLSSSGTKLQVFTPLK